MDRATLEKKVTKRLKDVVSRNPAELAMPNQKDLNMVIRFVVNAIQEGVAEEIEKRGKFRFFNMGSVSAAAKLTPYYNNVTKKTKETYHIRSKFRFFRKFGTVMKDRLIAKEIKDAAAEGNQLLSRGDGTGH